jgi:hypothetical protein
MSAENDDLRRKIDEAKQHLPLPTLMQQLGYGANVNTHGNAPCIFHDDQRPSFSLQEKADGTWYWHCFAGCGGGDEIAFLKKLNGLSDSGAISQYLEMAGFPSSRPPKSRECPKSHEYPKSLGFPESLKSPEYPVSNGQGSDKELEKELKDLATRYACTQSNNGARKSLFEIARGVRAIEKKTGRKLTIDELTVAFNEWHRVSGRWLDPEEDHLASFLAGLGKVRVPMGEGDSLNKALEAVTKLSVSELPAIPGVTNARESWRRIAALHREMSRRSANNTYLLSYRDAAKVFPELSHQTAYSITLALEPLGVIKIVSKGDARPSGKASTFRYLLPQTENGASQAENSCQTSKSPGGHNAHDCDLHRRISTRENRENNPQSRALTTDKGETKTK